MKKSNELASRFKTPEEARAFLRKVMGPPTRVIEGKEREDLLLILALKEPFKETNNQRSWTEYYMIGNKEFHVTYFPGEEDPYVDEILNDEDSIL